MPSSDKFICICRLGLIGGFNFTSECAYYHIAGSDAIKKVLHIFKSTLSTQKMHSVTEVLANDLTNLSTGHISSCSKDTVFSPDEVCELPRDFSGPAPLGYLSSNQLDATRSCQRAAAPALPRYFYRFEKVSLSA